MNAPIEFWPWADIPDDRRRVMDNGDREVLGWTFLGEPAWLPWVGVEP